MNIRQALLEAWLRLAYRRSGLLRWAAPILCPASGLYGRYQRLRRALYRQGRLASFSSPVPVISVGNLTVGGVGKTPLTLYLVEQLARRGYRPAVLLCGFGRTSNQSMILTREIFAPHHICQYGDEAAWFSFVAGVPVGIGGDRKRVLDLMLNTLSVDCVFLDDGFQHLRLRRNLDLVLFAGENPFGNGWCLPYGPLREPPENLVHADGFIVHGEESDIIPECLIPYQRPIFLGFLEWKTIRPLSLWVQGKADRDLEPEAWTGQEISLFSGIGNPDRLERQARKWGYILKQHYRFPDHHWYSIRELERIISEAGDSLILTTEKDAIRLLPLWEAISSLCADRIHVIRARWNMREEERFAAWLDSVL